MTDLPCDIQFIQTRLSPSMMQESWPLSLLYALSKCSGKTCVGTSCWLDSVSAALGNVVRTWRCSLYRTLRLLQGTESYNAGSCQTAGSVPLPISALEVLADDGNTLACALLSRTRAELTHRQDCWRKTLLPQSIVAYSMCWFMMFVAFSYYSYQSYYSYHSYHSYDSCTSYNIPVKPNDHCDGIGRSKRDRGDEPAGLGACESFVWSTRRERKDCLRCSTRRRSASLPARLTTSTATRRSRQPSCAMCTT